MDLSKLLSGKRVLITGASSGIGLRFAQVCAEAKAIPLIAARNKDKLERLVPDLLKLGAPSVEIVELDITDEEAVNTAIAQLQHAVDVLVNNAGINQQGFAIDTNNASFQRILDTNLLGMWSLSRACARRWIDEKRGGSIINIASISAARLVPGLSTYAISKAATIKLTESLALEWARYGIRVNAISPGYIATPINDGFFDSPPGQEMRKRIPLGRFGKPDDLDAALLLLATDASKWMTGTNLTVDGGHSLTRL